MVSCTLWTDTKGTTNQFRRYPKFYTILVRNITYTSAYNQLHISMVMIKLHSSQHFNWAIKAQRKTFNPNTFLRSCNTFFQFGPINDKCSSRIKISSTFHQKYSNSGITRNLNKFLAWWLRWLTLSNEIWHAFCFLQPDYSLSIMNIVMETTLLFTYR